MTMTILVFGAQFFLLRVPRNLFVDKKSTVGYNSKNKIVNRIPNSNSVEMKKKKIRDGILTNWIFDQVPKTTGVFGVVYFFFKCIQVQGIVFLAEMKP